mmetsp:Transcript_4140/g.5580  ORF Transcript_4140/g.5580 Transcript_4140/m.5580 type:complete len:324 (+) Transcript_4140:71-1042(+)
MMQNHKMSALNRELSNLKKQTEEDERSTSAEGSDSEVDAQKWESDSDSEKSKPTSVEKINADKVGNLAQGRQSRVKQFVQYLAGKCICPRRSPKESPKYDRNMLLQLRPPVDKQTKSLAPEPQAKFSTPAAHLSTPTLLPKPGLPHKKVPIGVTAPVGLAPPPGLDLPANLSKEKARSDSCPEPTMFDAIAFRKELVDVLRELSFNKNVGLAVQRVRHQRVPKPDQAKQFADLLTRSADEKICATRRLRFAFAAGLARAEDSAFEKSECIAGLRIFFEEVYEDLCEEVPRLRSIVAHELLPPLRTALPAKELNKLLPAEFRNQ